MLSEEQKKRLQEANYRLIGPRMHGAVKLCHWTKKSIKTGGASSCYKQKFYGIRSHQCVQMTPDLPVCNLRCSYCWRDFRYFKNKFKGVVDSAETIAKESVEAQKKLLVGLGGVEHSKALLKQAMSPAHAAISLDGEPTLYPHLASLIKEYHARGMTTFLVTNGTNPDRLRELMKNNALPTQLYVSLSANSREMFVKTQHPTEGSKMWDRILETLSLLPKIKTRRVIRLTLVRELNMSGPEKYAELIKNTNSDFVEVKGWAAVGQSRLRMPTTCMPNHKEIRQFAEDLVKNLPDYHIEDEQEVSHVVMIMRNGAERFLQFSDAASAISGMA